MCPDEKSLWIRTAEHLQVERSELDEMEVHQEWNGMGWIEVESVAFGEVAGCVTRLEWQAADSTRNSVAVRNQSELETGPVVVEQHEKKDHSHW